jgi:deoxycytidine triphosphate deaminase
VGKKMSVLTDREILDKLGSTTPFLTEIDLPANIGERNDATSRLYSAESPVQAASVDLHVGKIYLPGAEAGKSGSATHPITREYSLGVGQTILITTHEQFDLPDGLAGIGFTPFRVALRGVFITSVGHVDPGYQGPLRLIVVNMSKKAYSVRIGDRIATVLLFSLGQDATRGYRNRGAAGATGHRGGIVDQEMLDGMASSFLSLEDRMKEMVTHEVNHEVTRAWTWTVVALIITIILAAFGPISSSVLSDWIGLSSFHKDTITHIAEMQGRVSALQHQVDALVADAGRRGQSKSPALGPKP